MAVMVFMLFELSVAEHWCVEVEKLRSSKFILEERDEGELSHIDWCG